MKPGESPSSLPDSDPWASALGVAAVPAGDATQLTMEVREDHLNFLDGAHGGVMFSLAEAALRTVAGQDGDDPELIDAHLALTAGATAGDSFTATVHPVKVGRSLGVYRVSVSRRDGRLVGEMTGTVRFSP